MTRRFSTPPSTLIAGLAILALGLIVDRAFTSREAERFRILDRQRDQLLGQLGELESRDADLRGLARSLGYRSMSGALDSLAIEDPITFLTGAVAAARLARGELATRATDDVGALRRTQFFLVVRGPYRQISGFLLDLEGGARLTTIEGLVLSPLGSSASVEARINLSVYDPRKDTADGS